MIKMNYSPKLKMAMEEIKSILDKHDIGASIVLHDPGFSEFLLKVNPSYSCASFVLGELRIHSRLVHYNGDKAKQKKALEDTVNLVSHLKDVNEMLAHNLKVLMGELSKRVKIENSDSGYTSHEQQNN